MTNTTTAAETCNECGAEFPRFAYCVSCDNRVEYFDAAMDWDETAALHRDDQRYVEISVLLRDGARGGRAQVLRKEQRAIAKTAKATGRWARTY